MTSCQCRGCVSGSGDPVERANHASAHEHFANLEWQHRERWFPPLLPDHETFAVIPVQVRRVDETCHRFDCPNVAHSAHTA